MKRIYYLDWLRVYAFWILILFHSWLPFTTFGWILESNDKAIVADIFTMFFHTWRLHLIFLVSGIGTWFAIRKAKSVFLKNRIKRLLIPFIIASIFIIPPQYYVEKLQDNLIQSNYLKYVASYPEIILSNKFGYNIFLWIMKIGLHLWYLPYLFIMTIVALPLFKKLESNNIKSKINRYFSDRPIRLFLLAIPIILFKFMLKPIFPAYADIADFMTYIWSFIYGYILIANHKVFIKCVQKIKKNLLYSGVISSILLILGSTQEKLLNAALNPSSYDIYHTTASILIGFSAFSWTFFWVAFFSLKVNKNHRILKSANESILPIYIIHQTIIVCFGYFIIDLVNLGIFQFLLIVLSTVLLSIGFYKLMALNNFTRFLVGINNKEKPHLNIA